MFFQGKEGVTYADLDLPKGDNGSPVIDNDDIEELSDNERGGEEKKDVKKINIRC